VHETEEEQAERAAKAAVAAHRSILDLESNALYIAAAARLTKATGKLTWSDIRNTLLQEDMRIDPFVEMLQCHSTATTNRSYFINWGSLSNYRFGETEDMPIKPTIEFKQHACSLDAEEIQH
jgi:hypothetical protein